MSDYIQVYTTTESKEDAERISRLAVERRVAACAQVFGPIESTYRWEGKLETAKEWYCILKSRRDLYESLEKAIKDNHPYDVPEILAVPVVSGNRDYLDWLDREVGAIRGVTA